MKLRWLFRVMLLVFVLAVLSTPATIAQAPSSVSIYSIWLRLSLRGFNQEEIESLLRNMDPKNIATVKNRLRRTVLSNLEAKKIRERFLTSQDSDDLRSVRKSIETELRFAGMQSDDRLKLMIRNRFGIPIDRL